MDGKTQIIEQESAKTKSSMRTLPLVGRFKEYFAEVKAAQELNKQVCDTVIKLLEQWQRRRERDRDSR